MKNPMSIPVWLLALVLIFGSCGQTGQADAPAGSDDQSAQSDDGGAVKGQAYVASDSDQKNILQVAASSSDHTTLAAGVMAAGLENVLANNGPLTVFAPTNAAFDKLPDGTLDELLKPENKAQLASVITFHAAPGTYKGDLLKDGMKLFMATGDYVMVEVRDDGTYVHGTKILGTVDATNGVVHVVDDVMLKQ